MTNSISLTSHSLCPTLHSWVTALLLSGKKPGQDFTVQYLRYEDMPNWNTMMPPGAAMPLLQTAKGEQLSGGLPVLQYIDESLQAGLLPGTPAERVQIRNRALLAVELIQALRPILVSKTPEEESAGLVSWFAALAKVETQDWSKAMHLDSVMLAAAATVAHSQEKLMADRRWNEVPRMHKLFQELPQVPEVAAAKTGHYGREFSAFYKAFGSTYGT
jgi:glutathione S-transferase